MSNSEIGDPDPAVRLYNNIAGLYISMDYPFFMGIIQSLGYLYDNVYYFVRLESSRAHKIRQWKTFKEFHGYIDGSLVFTDVIDCNYTGMGKAPDYFGFLDEALGEISCCHSILSKYFKGDNPIYVWIPCLVHNTHGSVTNLFNYLIATVVH